MLLYSIVILVTAYIDGIVSMAVNTTEIRQFEGFRCSMQPENTSLPCTQYVITDPQYCNGNDEDLKRLFPGLYSIDDATGMGWPGPIRHESVVMDHADISWTAPQDGNVNFLKGYQVVQLGNSYFNLNMRVCTIIDLTHVTKEDFKTLTNTTFTIFNTSPGTVEVTIKPLPFPPDILLPAHIATMPPPPMQVEYHPQLNVFVDCDQINNSTVNISMFIDPVLEELHTLTVLVDSIDRGQRVGTMSVSAKQKYFTIGNLTMGAYKLEFIPSDDSEFGIISPCLCYTGTSDSRNCVPCRRYPKIIYVAEKVYDPSSKPSFSMHDAGPFPPVLG